MGQDTIQRMKALFASTELLTQTSFWQPLVDIYRTPRGWLVKYDLAGVGPDDVSLSVKGPCLTLCGVRRDCCVEEGCNQYRMEIAYSCFERTIELPDNLDQARLLMEFRRGMLLVRIEKEAVP
jgi:HSP20 family protein